MDAVKYLKEKSRMGNGCKAYGVCEICPLSENENGRDLECNDFELDYPEEAVAIVEKWTAEHPVKTRQDEFLEMFPNAEMKDGIIQINPCKIDTENMPCNGTVCDKYDICDECLREYWLAEVE